MKHKMKLRAKPFNMIRSGQKIYELRLYDEKRQLVQVNDEIEFSCLDEDETPFVVRVVALHLFNNFGELYATLPLLKCGYTQETIDTASPEDMNRYYSVEEQKLYTDDQLLEIVFNHIIPKMNAKYNVPESNIVFDEEAVREVLRFIDDFGARRTEKHIELLYKSLISSWVERETVAKTHVTEEMVRTVLKNSSLMIQCHEGAVFLFPHLLQ